AALGVRRALQRDGHRVEQRRAARGRVPRRGGGRGQEQRRRKCRQAASESVSHRILPRPVVRVAPASAPGGGRGRAGHLQRRPRGPGGSIVPRPPPVDKRRAADQPRPATTTSSAVAALPTANPDASARCGERRATQTSPTAASGNRSRPTLKPVTKLKLIRNP